MIKNNNKNIVFLTGAGISKESGINTFRDSDDGMWNNFDVKKLATIEAWHMNRDNMIAFYNARRKDMLDKKPNKAHDIITKICSSTDVNAIVATQNVDNLHEKSGLSEDKILHLHGNIMKNKSTFPGHAHLKYDSEGKDLEIGMKCEKGSQLRHDIVLFGDMLGNEYQKTIDAVREADILVIVGTSLVVEPVASIPTLVDKQECLIYYIDPEPNTHFLNEMKLSGLHVNVIKETATKGMSQFFTIFNNIMDPECTDSLFVHWISHKKTNNEIIKSLINGSIDNDIKEYLKLINQSNVFDIIKHHIYDYLTEVDILSTYFYEWFNDKLSVEKQRKEFNNGKLMEYLKECFNDNDYLILKCFDNISLTLNHDLNYL